MLIITCFSIFFLQRYSRILFSSSHYPLFQSFTVVLSCDAVTLSDRYFSSRGWSGNFAKVHDCGQRNLKDMSRNLRQ